MIATCRFDTAGVVDAVGDSPLIEANTRIGVGLPFAGEIVAGAVGMLAGAKVA